MPATSIATIAAYTFGKDLLGAEPPTSAVAGADEPSDDEDRRATSASAPMEDPVAVTNDSPASAVPAYSHLSPEVQQIVERFDKLDRHADSICRSVEQMLMAVTGA